GLIVDNPKRDPDGLVLLSRQLAIRGTSSALVPMYQQGIEHVAVQRLPAPFARAAAAGQAICSGRDERRSCAIATTRLDALRNSPRLMSSRSSTRSKPSPATASRRPPRAGGTRRASWR